MQSGPNHSENTQLVQMLTAVLTLPNDQYKSSLIQQIAYRYIYDTALPDGEEGPLFASEMNETNTVDDYLLRFEDLKQSLVITTLCSDLNQKMKDLQAAESATVATSASKPTSILAPTPKKKEQNKHELLFAMQQFRIPKPFPSQLPPVRPTMSAVRPVQQKSKSLP